jgi:hypothetical protein
LAHASASKGESKSTEKPRVNKDLCLLLSTLRQQREVEFLGMVEDELMKAEFFRRIDYSINKQMKESTINFTFKALYP